MKLFHGLVAGALLTLAVPVHAQSLGELAKREQERRKTLPPPAKTYTNEDLKKLPPPAGGDAATAAGDKAPAKTDPNAKPGAAAKPTEVKPDGTLAPDPAKDEKYWHDRMAAAREDVRQNEAFHDALQSRINALSADFAGRDDPFQRAKISDDRQKALAELARVTLAIDTGHKLIADIEEEARKTGVPPGWLR
jgi:hypothetical protein